MSDESNSIETMNTLDIVGNEINNKALNNALIKPYELTPLETVCEVNTVDTASEINTSEMPFKMNSLETICEVNTLEIEVEEENYTVPINTLETQLKLNTVETPSELNTVETVANESNNTLRMKTLDTTCEMANLDTACEMATLDTACEMATLDTACEMSTMDLVTDGGTSAETKTILKPVSDEMNYRVKINTFDSEPGLDNVDTSCSTFTSSVETVAESISPVKDIVYTVHNGRTSTKSSSLKKATTAEISSEEPLHKKAKLDSNDPVRDCQDICSNSVVPNEEKVKNDTDPKNDCETPASNLNSVAVNSEHISTSQKSSGQTTCSKDRVDGAEKQSALTEIQAGITEYLGSHKGFSAVIKQRYSDFIVNEIDVHGNVVRLTQLEPPESLDEEPTGEGEQGYEISSDIVSSEDIAKLESLIKSGDKKGLVHIVAPLDKDFRTKIHLAIKKKYSQMETKTAEVDGQKMIQVMWKTGNSRGREEDDWPESKKDYKYVKFVLYKENKDTMDAVGLIAKKLRVKEGLFQYAGTKDRRAKTSQEITAYRIHPKKLYFMNKVLWNIGLGNFQYVKEPLKLGQLSGNQFTIVLRNVQETVETIDAAMSSLKTLGFVNYFGMQRFGTTVVPTHRVGCALLHGDWEKAVDLILMPRNDNPSKDAFQKVWMETKDPEATLKATPTYCGLERNLLEALRKKMKPFNAIEKISRNTRMLYVHSYQALVWNQMVSKRLKVFGFKPVVGDLVWTDVSDRIGTERAPPVLVTKENLDQFSLHHVILPLPGYDVVYPKNEVHDWYRETLAADGVDIDNMKRLQKDYSLPGAYRHITVCPAGVNWTHHRYDDYSLTLTLSDMDAIKGEKLPTSQNKGKFKAVVLKMTLPSSTYATMALREVLRVDTSVAHQTSLNVT